MGDTSVSSDKQEITLATDCSGMELAPKILEQLGYKVRSLWVSETSEHALKFIRCNADPERIYRDMTERDSSELPKDVDIYLAGPPCTAWSSMNIKQKELDPRAELFEHCLATIDEVKPKVFIIENTQTLLTFNKRKFWQKVSAELDSMRGYRWEHTFLCPSENDCPQSRPRVYIVGVRRDLGVRHIPWPRPIPSTHTCLDCIDKHITQGRRVSACYWRMLDAWKIPHDTFCIIEPNGASRSHSPYHGKKGYVAELSNKQRASIARTEIASCLVSHDPSPFCPALKRHLTTKELLRLQAYGDVEVRVPDSMTALQVASLVGNAFNGAVLRRIFENLVPLLKAKA